MTIGERIRNRRIELEMTQDELAKKTGYKSRSSINKLESARVLPSRKIEKMAEALDCSPAYLMGWTDTPKQPIDEIPGAASHELIQDVHRSQFNNTLTDNERLIITAYRNSDQRTQLMILYMLKLEEMNNGHR